MAIPSYVGATLDKEVNTFGDWFDRTNQIVTDLGTVVMSVDNSSNGALTVGNTFLQGVFSANTIGVSELRGGTVDTPDLLTISSSVLFSGNSITANTETFSVESDTYVIAADVTTTSGTTLTYNTDTVNYNANVVNYSGTNVVFEPETVVFSSTDLIIRANTSFTANSVNLNNVVIDGSLTLANGAALTVGELIYPTFSLNANTTATGITYYTDSGYTTTAQPTFSSAGLDAENAVLTTLVTSTTAAEKTGLAVYRSRGGAFGTNGRVQNNDILGSVDFLGDDGSTFITGASIVSEVDGTPTVSTVPANLVFRTTAQGSSIPTERMVLTSGGILDISANVAVDNQITVNGNIVWHAGNDGSGSGLDADLLDGLNSTQFVRSDASDSMVGDFSLTGEFTVSHNSDRQIFANHTSSSGNPQLVFGQAGTQRGILQYLHSTTEMRIQNIGGNSQLKVLPTSLIYRPSSEIDYTVWHSGNDGTGSGLDADTVDGQHLGTSASANFGSVTTTGNISSGGSLSATGNISGAALSGTSLSLSSTTTTTNLREAKVNLGSGSAINLANGSYFTKTINGGTTFTISNVPADGTGVAFMLDLTNGGSSSITWWANIYWPYGTPPVLQSSGRDVLVFFTHDGGTTWNGLQIGTDMQQE